MPDDIDHGEQPPEENDGDGDSERERVREEERGGGGGEERGGRHQRTPSVTPSTTTQDTKHAPAAPKQTALQKKKAPKTDFEAPTNFRTRARRLTLGRDRLHPGADLLQYGEQVGRPDLDGSLVGWLVG